MDDLLPLYIELIDDRPLPAPKADELDGRLLRAAYPEENDEDLKPPMRPPLRAARAGLAKAALIKTATAATLRIRCVGNLFSAAMILATKDVGGCVDVLDVLDVPEGGAREAMEPKMWLRNLRAGRAFRFTRLGALTTRTGRMA